MFFISNYFLKKIPEPYRHLKKIQKGFLKCYFDMDDTEFFYKEIIVNKEYNFLRYNFFLANYFLFNNKEKQAIKIIKNVGKKNRSNLLIQETENFLRKGKYDKIKTFLIVRIQMILLPNFFTL